MKNIFKKAMTMALPMLALASCTDKYEYDGVGKWDAAEGYQQIYFAKSSETVELDPTDATTTTISLYRRVEHEYTYAKDSEGNDSLVGDKILSPLPAKTVKLEVLKNTDNVFNVSDAVFAQGDSVATITVTFPNAQVGTTYTLQLTSTNTEDVSQYSSDVLFTMDLTRVKWNDVGYYINNAGQKVEGYALYTEDFMTTFYGVQNLTWPTRVQERDDKKGYFRLINTYHAGYAYNDPGDWDDSKDYYIYIDATDPKKVYIPHYCETGMIWSYGMIRVSSMSGLYLARDDEKTASDYYGTYANGAITFPVDGLLISMANYGTGGFYRANGKGAFKLVLDPSLDPYVATPNDYDWEPLFESGQFTSEKLGTTTEGVAIYKGERIDSIEAENVGCYDRFEKANGVPYLIASPYTRGKHLIFTVNDEGKIVIPEDYAIQSTGIEALGEEVFAHINGGASTFSETEIALNITFQNEDGSVEYGTTTEVLANITWTAVGVGTFGYFGWWSDVDEEENDIPLYDPGYIVLQRDDQPNTYKLEDWGAGVDYVFTWDKKTNVVATVLGYIGVEHPSYGSVYVIDASTYSSRYPYEDYPSQYVPEENTFYFFNAYVVSAGSFGAFLETLEVEWDAATAQARHKAAKVRKARKHDTLQLCTPLFQWNGKKVSKVKTLNAINEKPIDL